MMEEEDKELVEESLEDLLEARQVWRSLADSPGWKQLLLVLDGQITARQNAEQNVELVEDQSALKKLIEYRAERRAFMLVKTLPDSFISTLTEDIEAIEDDNAE